MFPYKERFFNQKKHTKKEPKMKDQPYSKDKTKEFQPSCKQAVVVA